MFVSHRLLALDRGQLRNLKKRRQAAFDQLLIEVPNSRMARSHTIAELITVTFTVLMSVLITVLVCGHHCTTMSSHTLYIDRSTMQLLLQVKMMSRAS
jgi:hypothetical protein